MSRASSKLSRLKPLALLICLTLIAAVFFTLVPGAGTAKADSAHIGYSTLPKITKLIYPTLGNPAIKKRGENLVIEFDPRQGNFYGMAFPTASSFQVTATTTNTTNDSHYPVRSEVLPLVNAAVGYSTAWPELKQQQWLDTRIYKLTVQVAYDLPQHLYDLTVSAIVNGSGVTDSQPHAMQAIDEYKQNFSFCQLSDIHVFGPEAYYISSTNLERGQRQVAWDQNNGYGAKYFHKTIQQLNRTKPDFVIFTGDYDFGQLYFHKDDSERGYGSWGNRTEYEYEQLWFYQETLKLDVPVFVTIGNHDGYCDDVDQQASGVGDDWLMNFQQLYGPLYHGFDYGSCHFISLNSMDWSVDQRKMVNIFGLIQEPVKYLGCLNGGGDSWNGGGVDTTQLNQLVPANFSAQLAWLRDDLASHQEGWAMRIISLHHDPWKASGSGSMWWSGSIPFMDMGNGPGRLALLRLMRDYHVNMEISGHDHSDIVYNVNWGSYGGSGSSIMCNTTSVSFQNSTNNSTVYPGFRKVTIDSGAVQRIGYNDVMNPGSGHQQDLSYPVYQQTFVDGTTNMNNLTNPCIVSAWAGYNPNNNPGVAPSSQDDTCTVTNNYQAGTTSRQITADVEFPMPYLSGRHYYSIANGTLKDSYDNATTSPTHRMFRVTQPVNSGGASQAIRVYAAVAVDSGPPTGSVAINGGAGVTGYTTVDLNLLATDPGPNVSGVKDMIISNDPGFNNSSWEPYNINRKWKLMGGDPGPRTVYVKYRDAAMPMNFAGESAIYQATINYDGSMPDPNAPRILSCDPPGLRRGTDGNITIKGFNTNFINNQSAALMGTGVSVGSTTVSSQEEAVAYVMVSEDAVPGGRDVTVRNYLTGETYQALSAGFKVLDYPPVINSITPTSGPAGSSVAISGDHFEDNRGLGKVMLNGSEVTNVTSWNNNDITCIIPTGATSGRIKVVTESGESNEVDFVVTSPTPPIPAQPSKNWFLAEGSTRGGFETWVLVQNPFSEPTTVKLNFMTEKGLVPGPSSTLPGNSRSTFDVSATVPNEWSVSTSVVSDKPVIVERSMYWGNRKGGHDSIGVTMASKKWYLAEGCTRGGFETWVLVQNPGDTDTYADLTYMTGAGAVPGPHIELKAHTRSTVDVSAAVPNTWDVSTLVTANDPVIAERAVYWNGRQGGTDSIGVTCPTTKWFLAEGSTRGGFETWVLVQNPNNEDINAKFTFMTDKGEVPGPTIPVKANSRVSTDLGRYVPDTWNVSTVVSCDKPVIAERAVYWANRIEGHDSVGVSAPAKDWFLAEGVTRGGFETWVLVQNPGTEDAKLKLTYMTGAGAKEGPDFTLKAKSRASFFVADVVPNEWSVSTEVKSDKPVVVERSVYWNSRKGGHNSTGVPNE